jgi:hypothetical protein
MRPISSSLRCFLLLLALTALGSADARAEAERKIEAIGAWTLVHHWSTLPPTMISTAPDNRMVRAFCLAEVFAVPMVEFGLPEPETARGLAAGAAPDYACLVVQCQLRSESQRNLTVALLANALPSAPAPAPAPGRLTLQWRLQPSASDETVLRDAKIGSASGGGEILLVNVELSPLERSPVHVAQILLHAPESILSSWAGKTAIEFGFAARQDEALAPPDIFMARSGVRIGLRGTGEAAQRFLSVCASYRADNR